MQYLSFSHPVYACADRTRIDVDLVLRDGDSPIPYTAGQNDPESAGLYAAIVAAGSIAAYSAPATDIYIPAPLVRQRLQAAGKWEAAWAAMSGPQQGEFCTLEVGILTTDASVIALLNEIGADPVAILAVPT